MRAVLVAVLFLVLAAPARASTAAVTVGYCETGVPCNTYGDGWAWAIVDYVGAPGEANRLTVASNGQALILTDPATTITAKAHCVSIDAHTVSCDGAKPSFSADRLDAQLGDGDDTITIAPGTVPPTDLHGGAGDDVLMGGREDDTLDPGKGRDRVDGGDRIDTLNLAALHHPVTVDMAAGRTSEADTFTGIEAVRSGDRDDRLLGGPDRDELYGGSGDDVISGRGGDDLLSGDTGADHLDGGRGDDRLDGDPHPAFDAPDVLLSADVLRGGAGNDVLTDPGGANRMYGGPGLDRLSGGSGPDRLVGGPGNDTLLGHRGADRLSGRSGRDYLDGGSGPDRLFGGGGNDKLQARDHSADRADCGHGRDQAVIDARDLVHACEVVRGRGYTGPR
jgi:hypothetical protein